MPVYIVYFYSLLIFISLELSLWRPRFFMPAAAFILLLTVLFVWLLARAKFSAEFWRYLVSPFLFLSGGLLFLGFLNSRAAEQLLVLFLVAVNSVFLYWLVIYNFYKHRYKQHALSNVSRLLNISIIFFWLSAVSSLYVFFRFALWELLSLMVLITYLTIYQFFNINKIKPAITRPFAIIITLTVLELFYILTWLPLLSLVKAVLVASFYYYVTGLSKHYLQASLAQSVYWRYSLILGFVWLTVLLTARWG